MTDYHSHNHPTEPPGPEPWPGPNNPEWEPHQSPTPKHSTLLIWIAIALAAFLLLCSGLAVTALTSDDGEPQPGVSTAPTEPVASPPAADQPPATHKPGKTFRSGDFQYTIHGVKTGVAKVGKQYVERSAQGVFTRVDLTVKNMSKTSVFFDTHNLVKVEDKDGRQFDSDTSANITGNDGETGWLTQINPGNQVRAFAYFDLPKGVEAVRVVVAAGMLRFEADAIVPLPLTPPR